MRLYEELFAIQPELIVHDLHPDYASTAYALRRAANDGLPAIAVQHHHAHMASCMAEHGLTGAVIGVAFDGTGFGTDGAIWGGEFLVADYSGFRRAAHLRYVSLPGGDQAIRQPWRSAVAHAIDASCDASLPEAMEPASLRTVTQMIARGINSPLTSSIGRLFDAVAALVGIRNRVTFEGQAAMELEWLATSEPSDGSYPLGIDRPTINPSEAPGVIDTRPLIRAIVDDVRRGVDKRRVARRFQSTLVEMIADVCGQLRDHTGLDRVVLSGGVFMNLLLVREVIRAAGGRGISGVSPSPGAAERRRAESRTIGRGRGHLRRPSAKAGGQSPREIVRCGNRVEASSRKPLHVPWHTGKSRRDLPRTRRADGQGRLRRRFEARLPGAYAQAQPGQYVIVHVGFALDVIDEAEAQQVFTFLDRMNELGELKEGEAEEADATPPTI